MEEIEKTHISIRGVNPELYKQARIQALKDEKTIGEWVNEAIKEKLERSK